jgi:two-component SAPR family response regulator
MASLFKKKKKLAITPEDIALTKKTIMRLQNEVDTKRAGSKFNRVINDLRKALEIK